MFIVCCVFCVKCVLCLIDVEHSLDGCLKMIFSTLFCLSILNISIAYDKGSGDFGEPKDDIKYKRCLTGYMTDFQDWVDEYGSLKNTPEINLTSIDVSFRNNAMRQLRQSLARFKGSKTRAVRYLSMANCNLTRVPLIFNLSAKSGQTLAETLEYVTFYGNNFGMIYTDNDMYDVSLNASDSNEISVNEEYMRKQLTMWSIGFHSVVFKSLTELDLRSCSIQALGNHSFQRMPVLQSLYLGENVIHYIEANTFSLLTALKHLDLSKNQPHDTDDMPKDMSIDKIDLFKDINLESLDLSFTHLGQRNIDMIRSLEHSVVRLSVCHTRLTKVRENVFTFKQLKYLDVSGCFDILQSNNFLGSLKDTLQVLYADGVAMKDVDILYGFSKLEVLKVTRNEISSISGAIASSLTNLQILDLDDNRISTWFDNVFITMKNLKLLSLRNNNINIITRDMYYDIQNLMYIGLSGNSFVCNCYFREVFEVALRSEMIISTNLISSLDDEVTNNSTYFHTGFSDYNNIISKRSNLTNFCNKESNCKILSPSKLSGNYLFLDFNEYLDRYQCLSVNNGKTSDVMKLSSCSKTSRDFDMPEKIKGGWNKLLLLTLLLILLPLLYLVYIFRKNFRYFLITMKNSATLSLISNDNGPTEGAIFNYDVFVSYCNEDRSWVLDQLLPHVERDCNISVCLHERDFQVGLSILENIVSCMDRSRSIMLIISKRFLLSQWCQFEMHLAQHRLLETRREDLILILLEEIPRHLRPNTLHYLMLTKTYIVWPKEESEQSLFWRRMKKSLVTQVSKYKESVSLA